MPDRDRFFQGSELSRLAMLGGLALAGWIWVFTSLGTGQPPAEAGTITVDGTPPPIVADPADAFASVVDKTELGLRDTAAYAHLLEKARGRTPAALAAEARRDVLFTHLWERPEAYRGVPVHILGSARRVLRYDSKLAAKGWLYEAWVFTPESQNHPYVCVFEEAPQGLPIGDEIAERIVFNGYFLKLMKYQAGDTTRAAPVLVGKIGWTPRPTGGVWSLRSTAGVAVVMGSLLVITLLRWLYQVRRTASPRLRPSIDIKLDRPADDIAPEALADWVENVSDETERLRELGEQAEDGPPTSPQAAPPSP